MIRATWGLAVVAVVAAVLALAWPPRQEHARTTDGAPLAAGPIRPAMPIAVDEPTRPSFVSDSATSSIASAYRASPRQGRMSFNSDAWTSS